MWVGLLELLNDLDRPSFNSFQGIQIRKILVPVDGSECSYNAVKIALDLATKYKSELCFVHVVPTSIWRYLEEEWYIPPHIIVHTMREMEDEGERLLSSVLTSAREAGVKAYAQLDHGRPANKIIKMAREENFDLVVVGSSGHGAIARLFFGSVSDEIIDKAPCPVPIVKKSQKMNRMGYEV
jgi:nucleotide-binding universal stress UspA family protein